MNSSNEVEKICISPNDSLLYSMRVIDNAGYGIALVVSGQKLIGVLTDGDIRRALISGATLQDPIKCFANRNFVSVAADVGRAEILDLMKSRWLDQIPIIDSENRLLGLHLMHEVIGREDRPNWAVIMAGGKGTRLGDLTKNMPKPMLSVAGRPILERIVLHLSSFGIRNIFLSINYLGQIIEEYFEDGSRFGCKIDYLRENEPLGTAGSLSLLPGKPQDSILLINGDLVMQANFANMLKFHDSGNYFATMGLRPYAHEVAYGCVEVDGNQLTNLVEKPVLEKFINAGVYVLSPEAVESVPNNTMFPVTNIFEKGLNENKSCGAFHIQEEWIDIGRPNQLKAARGLS
jgi:dTDP-glucose pyrophosphorylase